MLSQVQQEALTEQEVALLHQPTAYQPWQDLQNRAQVCLLAEQSTHLSNLPISLAHWQLHVAAS